MTNPSGSGECFLLQIHTDTRKPKRNSTCQLVKCYMNNNIHQKGACLGFVNRYRPKYFENKDDAEQNSQDYFGLLDRILQEYDPSCELKRSNIVVDGGWSFYGFERFPQQEPQLFFGFIAKKS